MPQSRDVRHPTRPPSWSKLRQGCFENSAPLDAAVYIRTDLNTGLNPSWMSAVAILDS
jgi:hypothetical protein